MRMDKIIIDQTGIKQQVINEICELAQKYNVEQVLLFGSRSRGDYKRTSDIDLAVRGRAARIYTKGGKDHLWNNVTHSYNQNIALSIISQAKEKFYDMFCLLKKEIDENWI